ncbi:pyridoxal-dependent decarboxylase [Ornithinibacillus halotolerans]|uniref:Diaminopimelate decarboxylase n=1 Tax=Ornithinibacillus halotolerans TaxID=1274357 RepID=A0A916W7L4_9BACI|nr:pyridoxal-dependent decarboxylase [Ornithinibacillus halotolerans]GGA72868.1 diaminopimelate decarboxylase [Ornithinibacillus halotolerans]
MNLSFEVLDVISNKYGESFYLLDSKRFRENYEELLQSFKKIYPNTHIAYSYKTNYIPKLCKIVDEYGGYAEVVSEMEYKLAIKIGVEAQKIYFNGPFKHSWAIENLLLDGGVVNIDSIEEFEWIKVFAEKYPEKQFFVGVRCNFDIDDGIISRFGIDVHSEEFSTVVKEINETNNLQLKGLHCHFASRYINVWPNKVIGMIQLVQQYFKEPPEFVSVGGGLFGKMEDSLKAQFDYSIPDFHDYAEVIATRFKDAFEMFETDKQPKLIIEPGTALCGDAMKFVCRVISIKDIRGKKIATVSGSMYNINPTLNKKNPPITIYQANAANENNVYTDLDIGGYTCIESDYLYRGYHGELAVGDYIVFDNVGSYSIVLKPPFILPNFSVIELNDLTKEIELVKHNESFDDVFHTYIF